MYIYIYIYMSMCLYACMCVCMYVCVYVCMYVCMYVWMYVCMYECMYVCTYPYSQFILKLDICYTSPTLHFSRLPINSSAHHPSSCAPHHIFHFGFSLRIAHKHSGVLASSVPLPRACEVSESSVCPDKRFWLLTVQHSGWYCTSTSTLSAITQIVLFLSHCTLQFWQLKY